jgi:hypothetical protein
MRHYVDIINDYLVWYSKKINDTSFLPHNYLNDEQSIEDINLKKGVIWKQIMDLCYKPIEGIFWFTKFILGDLTYAGYPEPIQFNKLWWDWTKLVPLTDHLAIQCPRQHGKSTYWTVIQTIYRTAMISNYNVLIESASEKQAIMLLGYITRIIEKNEFLLEKKSKSAKWSTIELAYNGGKIEATGVGSEVRGGTYDYIACDDILRSDNKLSDEDIERFVEEELDPMILVRNGQIVIVGTPRNATDIFSSIDTKIDLDQQENYEGGWKMFKYQAILDWDKQKLLCPDRFTWQQIMNKLRVMGKLKFNKEFMCSVYASGSQLFPATLREHAKKKGKYYKLYSKAKPEEQKHITYVMGVDCARSGTASADYTVVMVLAFDHKTQEKRVVWIWRKKGLKTSEQVQRIAEISHNFGHPTILVEKNNIGQDFIDMMIDNFNLNVESFLTTKGSKYEDLIRYLINAFENEKIILPTQDEYSRDQIKMLEKELDKFVVETTKAGNEVYKGSGRSHDDMVIAMALANRCTQMHGSIAFAQTYENKHATPLERFAKTGNMYEVLKYGY